MHTAAHAQEQHPHPRVDAAEGVALGQGCVDLLPDEGVAEVVVADVRASKAHAANEFAAALDFLESRKVLQQQRVVARQQQRALGHAEFQVEVVFGVRREPVQRCAQPQQDGPGFLTAQGQQCRQTAVVRQRAHHSARASCCASLQL